MHWLLHSILANFIIGGLEFAYRSGTFVSYWKALPYTLPVIVVTNYLIFQVFRTSPNFLTGWAVLSFGNILCRFGTNWMLEEHLSVQMFFGVMLMAVGMFIIRFE